MKLLHIDSSILGENSVSRALSSSVVARLSAADSSLQLVRRDLAADPLVHYDLAAMAGDTPGPAAESAAVLEEFLAADTVVIGVAMYNFAIPSQLKAWIDRLAVAGKTFSYGAAGPEGLVGGKRVIIALSRGGIYGAEGPAAAAEHTETYLRTIFGFFGIAPEFVIAEGVKLSPEHKVSAIDAAERQIITLAA
ncbi:MAG: NAD(P)H-dependent oxidoreductase [Pseudomonadota bacterium]|uniref:FMN-dependent NADH-azoreductase n=1 Tax=Sphingomonas sp. ERG5 TaxID=1381597 RepID=UPI00054C1953|nr:NAD(P)H-dependent oxidoreductase [Sphingomonas sp. ERG5]